MLDFIKADNKEKEFFGLNFMYQMSAEIAEGGLLNKESSSIQNSTITNTSKKNIQKSDLVIILHGRAGNCSLPLMFSKPFKKHKPIIFSLEAYVSDEGGLSWWDKNNQTLEDIFLARDKVIIFMERLKGVLTEKFSIEIGKVFCLGFSQGAMLTSVLGVTRSDSFQSIVMLSGSVPSELIKSAALKEVSLTKEHLDIDCFIYHGLKDEIIPFSKAEEAKIFLESLGARVFLSKDDVGHKVSLQSMKVLEKWVSERFES